VKIFILLAHPDPKSFNHAIALEAKKTLERNGHEVFFHDLYAEHFDPNLPASELLRLSESPLIKKHYEEITAAEGLIIVHPNWWGQPPAILKGWVDRILRAGIAYKFVANDKGEGVPVGLLKAKTALVFNTANTPEERERDVFGDPLELIWKRCIFGLCGIKDVRRRTFTVVVTSTVEQRTKWLEEVRLVTAQAYAKG